MVSINRRKLFAACSTVAALSLATSPFAWAAAPRDQNGWRVVPRLGHHRVAYSRDEAMRYVDLIDQFGLPPQVASDLKRLVSTTPGQVVQVTDEHYSYMAFAENGNRYMDTKVWFKSDQGAREVERWTLDGETVDLPTDCYNFALVAKMCHVYNIDARIGSNVVSSRVKIEADFFRLDGKPIDVKALLAEPCLRALNAGTMPVEISTECGCVPGTDAFWPEGVPERMVPVVRLTFSFPSGFGKLTVPAWLATLPVRFCFEAATLYRGKPPRWYTPKSWEVDSNGLILYRSYVDSVNVAQAARWRESGEVEYPLPITPVLKLGQ